VLTQVAKEILDVLLKMRATGEPHALATVIETRGSSSAKIGAKAVIDAQGRVVSGWVGGGCAEATCCRAALDAMADGEPRVVEIDMEDEVLGVGMPCGGHMRVYVEPVLARPALWILGHGRVAEVMCELGDLMGLRVTVIDRDVTSERYPHAAELITDDLDYARLEPAADDFVVVATQHKGDHESMTRALRSSARHIALIASRKRARLVLDYLRAQGFTDVDLARVHAPAGLDLGARTPEEIALSIVSEIVLVRRGATGCALKDKLADERAARAAIKSVVR
jgi:xanthine dehydrogenase accessory factor